MSQWVIQPSYKLDLANFCNLLTQEPMYIKRHQEAYDYFSPHFNNDLVAAAQAAFRQGVLLGPGASSLLGLDSYDGHDIEIILSALDTEVVQNTFTQYRDYFPLVRSFLRHAHELGLWEYWSERCLPAIEAKCQELRTEAASYPVIEAVNALLGPEYAVRRDVIRLYVCHFAAPHGISLNNAAFIADQSWPARTHVDVALHELMHPPFTRTEIEELANVLWDDEFLQSAKARLPLGSGYAQPSGFVEENLVEGAHIYLAEQLGVVTEPLNYFIQHDYGSHVLSVLIYDALKQGIHKECNSYRDAVSLMQARGLIIPGKMGDAYRAIYERAGLGKDHPYQNKKL